VSNNFPMFVALFRAQHAVSLALSDLVRYVHAIDSGVDADARRKLFEGHMEMQLAIVHAANKKVEDELSKMVGDDPLENVTALVTWFTKLNSQFDELVASEKRGQLARKTDALRRRLYSLEADTQILRDGIPDNAPSEDQRDYLMSVARDLLAGVEALAEAVIDVGADLRLNDAIDVEEALTRGLRTRGRVLTDLERALQTSSSQWNSDTVRTKLDLGLRAVREAQLAITAFRRKLD
jgi:hypothetical protein